MKRLKKFQSMLLIVLALLTTTVSCAGTQTEMQTTPQMEYETSSGYTDIRSSWAYEAISYVLNEGLFEGTSETTFSPGQAMTDTAFETVLSRLSGDDSSEDTVSSGSSAALTREQTAVLLYHYIESIGLAADDQEAEAPAVSVDFKDASEIDSSAMAAVSTVTSLGLMSGKSDGSFSPSETATRAEAAAVIYRLCTLINEANTDDAFLAKVSEKTAAIDQYTDYKNDDYQTIILKGSSAAVSGTGAEADGSTVTITKAGAYVISGSLNDGRIVVDCEDDDNVRLVLTNAKITSSDGPAILVKNAKSVTVSLPSGTTNVLTDGSSNSYDEDAKGALSSSDDLLINGSGMLTVNANYKDGISGNDDIQITQAEIVIDAADDGISANDSISVNDADITVTAAGDGLKTTNGAEVGKGYIAVKDSSLDISSVSDGIKAETLLYIQGGSFGIDTSGGDSDGNSDSSKGLSAGCGLIIENGSFNIDSVDDALHSNGIISVKGGTFDIMTGDDALHAETSLAVSGGTLTITKCYEGLESKTIDISGGSIDLTASDDGFNAAGGADSSMGGRPGESSSADSIYKITISGGIIKVNASGDGLDTNGSAYMSGGTVIVYGPTNNGNGALDYNGAFEVTGGTLLAAGSSGMAQAPSSGSTQYTIANNVGTQKAGTAVLLTDSSGKTIASFTPVKEFSHVVISSPDIENGGGYTLYAGGAEIATFTVSSVISGDTSSGGGMQGGPGGGMQGGPGGMQGGPGGGGAPAESE